MKTYKYIALAALALSFAACSQEDDFTPQGNQKGAPITIASVGVANLATRATIEDDKLVEGNIGVTITSTGNDERYTGSNVRWYGSDGVWGLVENQKVVLYEGNGESQKIYAYYPYAKDIIEGTENLPVTLPEAFGSNFEGYDYLCTKEGISLSQNPVSLTLSHAFSKVSVSVNMMGNELEGDMVTEIALDNVPHNGERSATTGAIDPDKYGPANGRIALYGYDGEDYDEVADYYIGYALPNAATTLDLRATMQSGRIFTAKAPISGGMTDGVHYKIGLNLGKDKLEVRTVTIEPWGTGGAIEGGVAEEVIPASTEAELVAALENGGNIMLTGDITVSDEYWDGYEISKNTAIDLNGHTITGEGVFSLSGYEENIVLTISGNGTVKNTNPNFTSAISGFGTLNLLGGTIEGGTNTFGTTIMSDGWVDDMHTDKHNSDEDTSSITGGYVRKLNCWGGIVTISGGHVEALGIKYGRIIISGGTFGFDPTAYLAEGYTATEADGKWTVTPDNN